MTEKITGLALFREPFKPHQISKLPKPTKQQTEEVKADFKKGIRCEICGTWHHPKVVHLDYVGHAALTDRLLDVDPAWFWEPLAIGPDGNPAMDKSGGMWIKLTVLGVTRLGYGSADGKTGGDAVKEIIGDALRNAAMRFGAALDLWHKGDLHADDENDDRKPADTKLSEPVADKPKLQPKPEQTLRGRTDKLIAVLKAVETSDKLRSNYERASALCATLETEAPDLLKEIEAVYKARFNALVDAEREAA